MTLGEKILTLRKARGWTTKRRNKKRGRSSVLFLRRKEF